jgi:hypothetical protein
MSKQVQYRRGTTAQHATFTGANGEFTIDTDKKVPVIHDGATAGGFPSLRESAFNEFFINADARNSIYRGKYLGNTYTTAQQAEVAAGTFNDMFIGDYWTIGGINYRIAAFNYYRRTGDTDLTTNHLTLVPDTQLYTYAMNPTNTTVGGYIGSDMYVNGLTSAKSTINAAFPGKVLTHRKYLSNAIVGDEASAGAWVDSSVELMNEVMLYGSVINGSATYGLYNIGTEKSQLPLFSLNPKLINTRQSFWLRDVASAAIFAHASSYGIAYRSLASDAYGVRPAFSIS